MSGTKVMAQKLHFTPKSENCRKFIESPNCAISILDYSPLEHASERFEPSKDSRSLVVCTEKKPFEIWVRGFLWVSLRKRVGLASFGCSFMTSSLGQWAEIVAPSLVVF